MKFGKTKKMSCNHLLHAKCICEVVRNATSNESALCPLCRICIVEECQRESLGALMDQRWQRNRALNEEAQFISNQLQGMLVIEEEESEGQTHQDWLDQQEEDRMAQEEAEAQEQQEWLDQQEEDRMAQEEADEQAHQDWLDQEEEDRMAQEEAGEQAHQDWLDQEEEDMIAQEDAEEQAHQDWVEGQGYQDYLDEGEEVSIAESTSKSSDIC